MDAVSTWDLLLSLGFMPEPPPKGLGALHFDFGDFEVRAIRAFSPREGEFIGLLGVMRSPRAITEVECHLPLAVESREQGIAWLTWCLDHHAQGQVFVPAHPVPWLDIGRQHRHLLPWERRTAAFNPRPTCWAERDYARLALRKLRQFLDEADDPAERVTFSFDGKILVIRVGANYTALPAHGNRWPADYALRARQLAHLPKRLMSERVGFGVWDGALSIGGHRYAGVETIRNGSE